MQFDTALHVIPVGYILIPCMHDIGVNVVQVQMMHTGYYVGSFPHVVNFCLLFTNWSRSSWGKRVQNFAASGHWTIFWNFSTFNCTTLLLHFVTWGGKKENKSLFRSIPIMWTLHLFTCLLVIQYWASFKIYQALSLIRSKIFFKFIHLNLLMPFCNTFTEVVISIKNFDDLKYIIYKQHNLFDGMFWTNSLWDKLKYLKFLHCSDPYASKKSQSFMLDCVNKSMNFQEGESWKGKTCNKYQYIVLVFWFLFRPT